MELFAAQAREVDIIITTALIPNRPAPILITEDMVRSMKKGSVIVDLAAEHGGNCALTVPGTVVERHGVHIIGYVDLPSRLAPTASQLYGNNLVHLLEDMGGDANFKIDLETRSSATRSSCTTARSRGRRRAPQRRRRRRSLQPAAVAGAAPPKPAQKSPVARGRGAALARRRAVDRARVRRAAGVPPAPHGVRARVLRRLAGRLERHAGAAHAADERHQRDQRHHRDRRHAAADGPPAIAASCARRGWRSSCPRSTSPAASS